MAPSITISVFIEKLHTPYNRAIGVQKATFFAGCYSFSYSYSSLFIPFTSYQTYSQSTIVCTQTEFSEFSVEIQYTFFVILPTEQLVFVARTTSTYPMNKKNRIFFPFISEFSLFLSHKHFIKKYYNKIYGFASAAAGYDCWLLNVVSCSENMYQMHIFLFF